MLRSLVVVLLACWSTWARAQEAEPVRDALASWGCEPSTVLALGERWYAACGTQSVFVVERQGDALVLGARRHVPGSVRGIYEREGVLWVESTHVEARPLDELPPEAAIGSAPVASLPAPVASLPAPPIQEAEPPPPPPESKLFPSRASGVMVIEASLRPVLPIGTRALAAMAELTLSYVGERHWFAELRGFPLGGMIGSGNDVPLMGAIAQAGYDHPYFAVGLGAGALTRGGWYDEFDPTTSRFREFSSQSTRPAISQYARLGPRDGLNLSAQSVFVLLDEWAFGFVEVRGQIPLVRATWLNIGGAGGSQAGFFYTELGLRRLVRGDRGSGSLFVRPSVGVAGVDKRDGYYGMRIGPMVGFHLEWRR